MSLSLTTLMGVTWNPLVPTSRSDDYTWALVRRVPRLMIAPNHGISMKNASKMEQATGLPMGALHRLVTKEIFAAMMPIVHSSKVKNEPSSMKYGLDPTYGDRAAAHRACLGMITWSMTKHQGNSSLAVVRGLLYQLVPDVRLGHLRNLTSRKC